MKKKSPKKNRVERNGDVSQDLAEIIKTASKAIYEAKSSYRKTWEEWFLKMATEMGYLNPRDASFLIMEEVENEIYDDTADDWEKQLTIYARRQFLDWKREQLDEEISKLQSEKDGIK